MFNRLSGFFARIGETIGRQVDRLFGFEEDDDLLPDYEDRADYVESEGVDLEDQANATLPPDEPQTPDFRPLGFTDDQIIEDEENDDDDDDLAAEIEAVQNEIENQIDNLENDLDDLDDELEDDEDEIEESELSDDQLEELARMALDDGLTDQGYSDILDGLGATYDDISKGLNDYFWPLETAMQENANDIAESMALQGEGWPEVDLALHQQGYAERFIEGAFDTWAENFVSSEDDDSEDSAIVPLSSLDMDCYEFRRTFVDKEDALAWAGAVPNAAIVVNLDVPDDPAWDGYAPRSSDCGGSVGPDGPIDPSALEIFESEVA
jgi:hypothetical protein